MRRRVLIGSRLDPTRDELEQEREREQAERRAWAERTARERGWTRYDQAELEPYGRRGLLAHRPSDALLEPLDVDPDWTGSSALTSVTGWYVDEAGLPRFVGRPSKGPRTLAEDRAQAAERRRAQAEREQAEAERLAADRRPLTLAELDGTQPITLRAAAEHVAAVQGLVHARDGELIVEIPQRCPGRDRVLDAARVLFAARDLVLAELARTSTQPLAERLPDAEALAGGGIAE